MRTRKKSIITLLLQESSNPQDDSSEICDQWEIGHSLGINKVCTVMLIVIMLVSKSLH